MRVRQEVQVQEKPHQTQEVRMPKGPDVLLQLLLVQSPPEGVAGETR